MGVSTHPQNPTYRALGAPKAQTFGNGRVQESRYDNRLTVKDWTVGNVLGWQYSYSDLGEIPGA